MSLALKIGIVVLGLVFYFFSISTLLSQRRDIAEQQVLFDSIDNNADGVLTTQEINGFWPCRQSNKSKLVTRLHSIGPSVTFDQFQQDVNKNMIKYTIAPCAANAHLFANPAEMSKRTQANTVEPFMVLYDLNKDGSVRYNEYQLVNKFHGRSIKGSTETFVYLDANNDWELNRAELSKAKLGNLDPKLPESLRRKPILPRHGHHAAAPVAPVVTEAPVQSQRVVPERTNDRYIDRRQQRDAPNDYGYYGQQRQPNYDVGPGEYDIVYNPRESASERIERERRLARQSQYRDRAGYSEQPQNYGYQSRGYGERTYNQRAYNERPYDRTYDRQYERTRERPVRDEFRQNQRLQVTGRLDSLSGPRPRQTVYRERNYEYGL